MTKQVVLRSPAVDRRQPLLASDGAPPPKGGCNRTKFGEVAGGTAADCAAVCCCCPCGLMNLLLLAVYRIPVGLLRKSRLRRQRRKKDALLPRSPQTPPSLSVAAAATATEETTKESGPSDEAEAAERLEREMWNQFYGAGFWRSPSQRES